MSQAVPLACIGFASEWLGPQQQQAHQVGAALEETDRKMILAWLSTGCPRGDNRSFCLSLLIDCSRLSFCRFYRQCVRQLYCFVSSRSQFFPYGDYILTRVRYKSCMKNVSLCLSLLSSRVFFQMALALL